MRIEADENGYLRVAAVSGEKLDILVDIPGNPYYGKVLIQKARADGKKWEKSERYPGYVFCPECYDTFIDPEWIKEQKWRFCPTCGTRLEPPEDK